MLSHTLFHLILQQAEKTVGKKNDFFRFTMSIFRPMGTHHRNTSEQDINAHKPQYHFGRLTVWYQLASVKEEGIRTDTRFSWYSKNCKNTARIKEKKDALEYRLTETYFKACYPLRMSKIIKHGEVRRDLRNCLMELVHFTDKRTEGKITADSDRQGLTLRCLDFQSMAPFLTM